MSILSDIINEIRAETGRPPTTIRSSSKLREDLGLDSLELAVLTVKIEAATGIDVFADGMVSTVGEIEQKIQRGER